MNKEQSNDEIVGWYFSGLEFLRVAHIYNENKTE